MAEPQTSAQTGTSFDPDAFLRKKYGAGRDAAPATPAAASFDPDAFMARKQIETDAQSFFARHPVIREGIMGAFSGFPGVPETSTPVRDFFRGMYNTLARDAETPDEHAFMAAQGTSNMPARIPLPVYRMVKGLLQTTKGITQQGLEAIDWTELMRRYVVTESGQEYAQAFGKEGGGDVIKDPGALAHSIAGLAAMILSFGMGGKKAAEMPERVESSIPSVDPTGQRVVTVQGAAGTGPRLAEKVATKELTDVTKSRVRGRAAYATAEEAHQAAVAKVEQANQKALADYQTKLRYINEDLAAAESKVRRDYADNIAARDAKLAEQRATHADRVSQARQEWIEKKLQAQGVERENARIEARRESLTNAQRSYAELLMDHVRTVHDTVRSTLNKRWDAFRDEVGTERAVDPVPIYDAIQSAREKLAGVPADLQVFNQIVKDITEKPAEEPGGQGIAVPPSGAPAPVTPSPAATTTPAQAVAPVAAEEVARIERVPKESIPFDRARTQFSKLGEKVAEAEGNVRRVLSEVYDAYDKSLTQSVEQADVERAARAKPGEKIGSLKKMYESLKRDWAQYSQDWHNTSSMSLGRAVMPKGAPSRIVAGSPLARAFRSGSIPDLAGFVTGKFSDQMFATFARYQQYGANARLMAKLRNLSREFNSLPKLSRVPSVASRPKTVEAPSEPAPIEPPDAKLAELRGDAAKKSARLRHPDIQPTPDPPALPDLKRVPTIDEMIETVRKAKIERAKDFAAEQRWHAYDAIMASWLAFGTPEVLTKGIMSKAMAHAGLYLGARWGWMKFIKSPLGLDWMTRVTPQDISAMVKVYEQFPEARAEASSAIGQIFSERARTGQPLPAPPAKFRNLLDAAQMATILRLIAPPPRTGEAAPPAVSGEPGPPSAPAGP